MNSTKFLDLIPNLMLAAALGQAAIAMLNLSLVSLLGWKKDLAAMPLLVREVFRVHQWFITITLLLFAFWTWKIIPQIGQGSDLAGWILAGISLFWGIRTILQVTYYSSSHWKGKTRESLVHVLLLLAYGGCSLVYATGAWICLGEGS